MKKHLSTSDVQSIVHNIPSLSRNFSAALLHASSCASCRTMIESKKKKFKIKMLKTKQLENVAMQPVNRDTFLASPLFNDLKRILVVVLGVFLLVVAFLSA